MRYLCGRTPVEWNQWLCERRLLETEYSLRVNTQWAQLFHVYEDPCLRERKLLRFSFLVGKRPYVDCKQCKSREKQLRC
jgi:hypothetical protein